MRFVIILPFIIHFIFFSVCLFVYSKTAARFTSGLNVMAMEAMPIAR